VGRESGVIVFLWRIVKTRGVRPFRKKGPAVSPGGVGGKTKIGKKGANRSEGTPTETSCANPSRKGYA